MSCICDVCVRVLRLLTGAWREHPFSCQMRIAMCIARVCRVGPAGRWWVVVGGDSDAGDRWGPTATPTAADRLTAVRARGAGGGAERQREAAGNGETVKLKLKRP